MRYACLTALVLVNWPMTSELVQSVLVLVMVFPLTVYTELHSPDASIYEDHAAIPIHEESEQPTCLTVVDCVEIWKSEMMPFLMFTAKVASSSAEYTCSTLPLSHVK
jgi:hypothetical protein